MLTFGSSAYLGLYAPERLKHELSPAIWRLALAASVVVLATAIVWLMLELAAMADDSSAAVDPERSAPSSPRPRSAVRGSRISFWRPRSSPSSSSVQSDRWAPTAVASGALLASLGLVGHAAMQTGAEGVLHRGNHAVHLLAAGAWIGGLVPFVMCLSAYERSDTRREAVTAMMRFSFTGQFIVAAIVLTGGVNIALTSGRPPIPPDTPYRALLDAKIVIVAMMILAALFNRYVLAPQLKPGARALAVLRATSTAEVAFGAVAIALVSVFALLDPA